MGASCVFVLKNRIHGELALQAERMVCPSTREPDAGNAAVGMNRVFSSEAWMCLRFFVCNDFLKGERTGIRGQSAADKGERPVFCIGNADSFVCG